MIDVEFSELKGLTLTAIERRQDDSEIEFTTDRGFEYRLYHQQDCCESVTIEDVCGELEDLVGSPILLAEEVSEDGQSEWGFATWTFYKLSTIKGSVTIRWFGESNGYYSESVDFVRAK